MASRGWFWVSARQRGSQMKSVRGPESESRLVGLQIAEVEGLSGKGRAT